MSPPRSSRPSTRESMLTLMLLTLGAAGFLVVLVGIMGVFILHAVLILGVLCLFGCFHYFLWGRALSEQVAPEREEEVVPTDADGYPLDGPHGPHRF